MVPPPAQDRSAGRSDLEPRLSSPSTGVVVTGGGSGIGLATARALAAVGRPVAIWDLHGPRARAAALDIAERSGVPAVAVTVDVRDPDAIGRAVQESRTGLRSIGGFVHCAGTVDTGSLEGITLGSWDDGMNVHLRPVVLLAQALWDDLRSNPGSAIVATASINATLGNARNPVYTAAKGAVLSLVRSLADRLAADGIRVNAVSPGQIHTAMTAPVIDRLGAEHFQKRILLERIGIPEEIARVNRFLLSDEASYITAAEIVVDGGNISSQR